MINAATKTIRDFAVDNYSSLTGSVDDNTWFYEIDPKEYLTSMAEDLVSLEMDGSNSETGEMFPEWCSLVVTPAIERTIDWDCVRAAVIEMYEEQVVDYLFGDDE